MELIQTLRHHEDEKTKVVDLLKLSLSPAGSGLHEMRLTRTSSNSRDPKVQKYYLSAEDMFELESAIRVYNKGLVD